MTARIKVAGVVLLTAIASTSAFAGSKHYYLMENGEQLTLCRDQDGFTAYMEDGSTANYGRDVSWDEIKEKYNVTKFLRKSPKRYDECPSS